MHKQARIVIIGAGIVGVSTAYHLYKRGWRDVVVVDQNDLFETHGSTSHAPGLVFQTNSSKLMTEFAMYTVNLMKQFDSPEKRTVYQTGGIEVARSEARLAELHRRCGFATAYGLEARVITPAEVKEMIPIINEKEIYGGYYVPSDADAKSVNFVEKLAAAASQDGAVSFYGGVKVTDIDFETHKGHVTAVITPKGRIETEQVLLCTNIWSPVLGDKVGLPIPLMGVEHLYAITEPLPDLANHQAEVEHPILRDQDYSMYYRQHHGAYGIGSYQHESLLVNPYELHERAMRPFTPEHFEPAIASTELLLPALKGKELATKFNGMFSFTIDGMPVMGEAPRLKGFWVACGVWVTHSGGVGRAMADWLTDGGVDTDLREADLNRFHEFMLTPSYIKARCYTQYDEVYDLLHPLQQLVNPRDVRLSPFHARIEAQQPELHQSAGWERAHWCEANAPLVEQYDVPHRTGWEAREWSPIQGGEHLATRERVAMYDLTAFTKIEVSGPGALAFLEYLAANKIEQPIGKVIYTAMCDEKGGIRADLTITQLEAERFMVLTGGANGMLDLAWLRQHAPTDGSVTITDVTSHYCAIGLWGPKARDVLAAICEEDVSNEAFPYFTAKKLNLGPVPAFALRVSYVGELGWEIYARTEFGLKLWDMLWQAGQAHEMIVGGFGAFDSLRLEKGYRSWGADIHSDYNPYEAGLGWAVKLKKGDFLGREALLKIKEAGVKQKLCCLTLNNGGMALGKEPILNMDGERLGYVTSANYGYSVGLHIVYGYLPLEYASEGTTVQVKYFDRLYAATVTNEPLFDPKGEKMKG